MPAICRHRFPEPGAAPPILCGRLPIRLLEAAEEIVACQRVEFAARRIGQAVPVMFWNGRDTSDRLEHSGEISFEGDLIRETPCHLLLFLVADGPADDRPAQCRI